jgi:hypothetical protein
MMTSGLMTSFVMTFLGFGEDMEDKLQSAAQIESLAHAIQVGAERGLFDFHIAENIFVAHAAKEQFNGLRLPWRQVHVAGNGSPSLIGKRKWWKSSGSFGRHEAPKKERRTKAAHGAPAKGHGERTLADAPFGARLKALLLQLKLGGFP